MIQVRTVARKIGETTNARERLSAGIELANLLDHAETHGTHPELRALTPPLRIGQLFAQLAELEKACAVPPVPAPPESEPYPSVPRDWTFSIRGRYVRTETGGILGAPGILVSDGEHYFLIEKAEAACFPTRRRQLCDGTGRTTHVDVAGGREAKVVLVSDRAAFDESHERLQRGFQERRRREDSAQRKYEADLQSRALALSRQVACKEVLDLRKDQVAKEAATLLTQWGRLFERERLR
jgi:hypothetical protein